VGEAHLRRAMAVTRRDRSRFIKKLSPRRHNPDSR
jgi:hypothetical protein